MTAGNPAVFHMNGISDNHIRPYLPVFWREILSERRKKGRNAEKIRQRLEEMRLYFMMI